MWSPQIDTFDRLKYCNNCTFVRGDPSGFQVWECKGHDPKSTEPLTKSSVTRAAVPTPETGEGYIEVDQDMATHAPSYDDLTGLALEFVPKLKSVTRRETVSRTTDEVLDDVHISGEMTRKPLSKSGMNIKTRIYYKLYETRQTTEVGARTVRIHEGLFKDLKIGRKGS